MSVETRDPTPVRSRTGRGPGFYLGLALVLAGLAMLGYVGWQYYGTNIVAQRTHQRVVSELREHWRAPAPAAGAATAEKDTSPGRAYALLRIPRFGEDYVVPVLEGVSDEVLASGFGHFPGTAGPGEEGNYALAAHRVTHGEPLRDMPQLRPGDQVVVETRDTIYTYELDTDPNDLVVGFQDVWVVDPLPDNPTPGGTEPAQEPGQRLITLTTCSELFHTDNRMIAFGHLVEQVEK